MPDADIDILHEAAILLAQSRTATLATVDAQAHPHAANIQFAHDDHLRLYFVSNHDAAHSQHIALNPSVALTIYHHNDQNPANIHGLQLHGQAKALTNDTQRNHALTLYTARFPFITSDPTLLAAVHQQTFYSITPTWLRLIDNRKGFGWKMEIDMPVNKRE
jgi:uncharacterized protein